MDLKKISDKNLKNLSKSKYPGRGLIIGCSPNSRYLIQVYWIMGRSTNSRNRIFTREGSFVKTDIIDRSKVKDPSLILYYPVKDINNVHIASNGDQTDTILNCINGGQTFEEAIKSRKFEPDDPNFTPRISGIIDLNDTRLPYWLSIIKTYQHNPDICHHYFYNYEKPLAGYGHCITTYIDDGSPIPSFIGEPQVVELYNDIIYNTQFYWDLLNKKNRVSILSKFIDIESKNIEIEIINKYGSKE